MPPDASHACLGVDASRCFPRMPSVSLSPILVLYKGTAGQTIHQETQRFSHPNGGDSPEKEGDSLAIHQEGRAIHWRFTSDYYKSEGDSSAKTYGFEGACARLLHRFPRTRFVATLSANRLERCCKKVGRGWGFRWGGGSKFKKVTYLSESEG